MLQIRSREPSLLSWDLRAFSPKPTTGCPIRGCTVSACWGHRYRAWTHGAFPWAGCVKGRSCGGIVSPGQDWVLSEGCRLAQGKQVSQWREPGTEMGVLSWQGSRGDGCCLLTSQWVLWDGAWRRPHLSGSPCSTFIPPTAAGVTGPCPAANLQTPGPLGWHRSPRAVYSLTHTRVASLLEEAALVQPSDRKGGPCG